MKASKIFWYEYNRMTIRPKSTRTTSNKYRPYDYFTLVNILSHIPVTTHNDVISWWVEAKNYKI